MSQPNRPEFKKGGSVSTSSASSSTTTPSAGGGRWNTGYSPVRGLSPMRNTFQGVARQDMDSPRSHTNPLFSSRTSDAVGRNMNQATTPSKSSKDAKENHLWKVPVDKAQYGTKTLSSTPTVTPTPTPLPGKATPGKPTPVKTTTRTPTTSAMPMRFATPPKPVARRKILAENRDLTLTPARIGRDEDGKKSGTVAPTSFGKKEAPNGPTSAIDVTPASRKQNDGDSQRGEGAKLPSTPAVAGPVDPKPKSPLASIEELQKRIQKFLQDEESAAVAATTVPAADARGQLSPIRGAEGTYSQRRYSGSGDGAGMPGSAVGEAPYHTVFAPPYSPRREFLRVSKSPTSSSLDGTVSSPPRAREGDEGLDDPEIVIGTPTYDPRNNFLSPRPQFLRYKPLRRLEVLRKSAEGTLGIADLELDSPAATDGGSSRVESSEKDDGDSPDGFQEEVQSLKTSPESRDGQSSPTVGPVPSEKVEVEAQCESYENSGLESGTTTEQRLDSTSSPSRTPPAARVDAKSIVEVAREVAGWEGKDVKPDEGAAAVEAEDEKDEDETASESEWLEEDGVKSTRSRVLNCVIRMLVILAVSALLLSASGSTGLLPSSLHQNRLALHWKSSRAIEPVRQLLQSTQGLWLEHPSHGKAEGALRPFPKFSVDGVRAGCWHFKTFLASVELDRVQKAGRVLWSSSKLHVANLRQYAMTIYRKLKALAEDHANYLENSRTQDVDKWGWVAEYDFVVPHDIADSSHVHEIFLSPMMEALSGWSYFLSDVGYDAGRGRKKYVTVPVGVTGDSIRRVNFSVCPVQGTLEEKNLLPSILPVPIETVSMDPLASSRQKLELISAVDQQDAPSSEDDGLGPESSTASFSMAQEPGEADDTLTAVIENVPEADIDSSVGTSPSSRVFPEMMVSTIITDDEQQPRIVEELVDHIVESIEAPVTALDFSREMENCSPASADSSQPLMLPEVQSSEDSSPLDVTRPEDFNEGENFPPLAQIEPFTPIEQETAQFLALEERPEAGKFPKIINTPFLQNLQTRGSSRFRTAAVPAVVASLLLLAAGWMALHKTKKVAGSSGKAEDEGKKMSPRPSENDLIGARPDGFSIFSSAERSPQLFQSTFLQPFDNYSTDRYSANDYSASDALFPGRDLASFFAPENYVEPLYPTMSPDPYPIATDNSANINTNTTTKPEKFYSRRRDTAAAERLSSPPSSPRDEGPSSPAPLERSASKHAADDTSDFLPSPEVSAAVLEDSSLGRFTAFVPVVRNEGTFNEQVKLTPVKRSSRIRTRLLSPCKPGGHHHHLCSCEEGTML